MATVAGSGTLPFAWYVDEEVARREQEAIFRRAWQYVGHSGQAPEPGSFFAGRCGDVPVLVTRARDGVLRAFLNVCRHRGSLLVEGEGRRATVQCPYHAWTYELDGTLRRAPRTEREPGFVADGLGLRPLAVGTWGPFVFVNPDAEAAPLADTLADLPALVARAGVDVDALAFHGRTESTYAANWKVCCENFLECYHCQVAHPGLVEVLDVSPDAYALSESGSFSTQVGPLRDDAAASAFDPRGEVPRGQFHFLLPNVTINISPGRPNLSVGPVLPDGPRRTTRFLDYFFAPDVEESWIREFLAWDGQVGAEDTVLVERVQRGVASGLLEGGVLLPESERLIAHFDRFVTERLERGGHASLGAARLPR
jgi:phenylpropionate dioxygenase-like ring-hydroxylating dioxygenase large terminal subunit